MDGCSVFTRPSMISGNPVTSTTSATGNPASRSVFAVPPVEIRVTLRSASARANSTSPVLSETEISARRIGRSVIGPALLLAKKPKEKRENETDDEAGDDRKINLHAGPVDRDIAGQAAKAQLPQPRPEESDGDQRRAEENQRSADVHERAHTPKRPAPQHEGRIC